MKRIFIILPFILTLLSLLNSEEKGVIYYNGDIGELKDSTIKVPDEAIALYERVIVDMGPGTTTVICPLYIDMPLNIVLNGDSVGIYDTSNRSFLFDNHIPFSGEETDFIYKINYRVAKDSVLPNGDTIVVQGDSTTEGTFSIVVDPNVTDPPVHYPNIFEIPYWDRSLGFFYKNTPISSMNKGMDTLAILFREERVDILYGYDSVSVTITNSEGNIDSETLNLLKIDSTFIKLFTLAVDSTPTQNDGILQLFDSDTVTAVFRNPKLPLDTLKLSVPFYPTTAVNPNSYNNQKLLSLNFINSSILYNLPTAGNTRLQIYNMKGRLISTLVDSYKHAGKHTVNWDCKRFGSGVYYIKLSTGSNILIRKAVILK